jgi:predicted nuclease with TOPRIM domain
VHEELSWRVDKLSEEKGVLLEAMRELEGDYRIVKEDLKAVEEKHREAVA